MENNTQPATTNIPRPTDDTYSYRGWLISDSFLKRALAVTGYTIAGQLIIIVPIYILGALLLFL